SEPPWICRIADSSFQFRGSPETEGGEGRPGAVRPTLAVASGHSPARNKAGGAQPPAYLPRLPSRVIVRKPDMETLVLKVLVTPALIGGASLAARRWGHQVSGWLVGLPLTSGPIAFFLALERGTSFAAAAAIGSLAGAVAEAAFCVAYAAAAP